jgi:hypothetical protein
MMAFAAVVLTAACSTPAQGRLSPRPTGDILSAAELATMSGTTQNAYSAVERLRPLFLVTRPGSATLRGTAPRIHVFINGEFAGDLDVLRTIPVAHVESIRHVHATEAYTQHGEVHAGDGVLMIRVH